MEVSKDGEGQDGWRDRDKRLVLVVGVVGCLSATPQSLRPTQIGKLTLEQGITGHAISRLAGLVVTSTQP